MLEDLSFVCEKPMSKPISIYDRIEINIIEYQGWPRSHQLTERYKWFCGFGECSKEQEAALLLKKKKDEKLTADRRSTPTDKQFLQKF